jgi:hypothetical protein
MLYRIAAAAAHPDHKVVITWSDGVTASVDLAPVIATGPVFAAMRDGAWFAANMRVAPDRLGLEWPNDVDFSADGLRLRAFPEAAEAEFAASSQSA